MDFAALGPVTQEFQAWLVAAAFGLARITGLMFVTPVFTRFALTGLLRNAAGLALAAPVLPMIAEAQRNEPLSAGIAAVLLGKEVAVGLIIGLVAGIPFWAAELAGSITDLQRGASLANFSDASSEQATITGTLLTFAMLALFLSAGGLRITLSVFYESYALWPVNRLMPVFGPDAGDRILTLLDNMVAMGLLLVAPLVIALLLSDLLLGLVSRAAPQLHIFDLSLNMKNLLFAFLIVLYSGFMLKYMEYDLRYVIEAKERLEAIRGPLQP
jgi:type III secretion protein T